MFRLSRKSIGREIGFACGRVYVPASRFHAEFYACAVLTIKEQLDRYISVEQLLTGGEPLLMLGGILTYYTTTDALHWHSSLAQPNRLLILHL